MTIQYCPNCNQRYQVGFDCTDYVHQCNSGNLNKDQEDVSVEGSWEDFSGSATVPAQQVNMQGAFNELQGTRAETKGIDKEPTTRHGNRVSTHRQRQTYTYINLKEDCLA